MRVSMTEHDVLEFLDLAEEHDVRIWLDGGWAVDACLGHQTRSHADLDIVLQANDLNEVVRLLRDRGYKPAPRNDTRLWNFAMGDQKGREVDFHVVVLDTAGNGIYGPPENGEMYPAEALTGSGVIGVSTVACITPAWLVKFHSGYELDDNDRADVSALCERFDIPLPTEFEAS